MLVFRTGASPQTGFGSLKRSAYLASLLKKHCSLLFFINSDKTAINYIKNKKFKYIIQKDLKKLEKAPIRSIIFDLKHFDHQDITLLQWAKKSSVITAHFTDMGMNQQDADYTIDASIGRRISYKDEKKLFEGPDFRILHTSFRHFNRAKRKYMEMIKNIFICLGGSADYRILRKIIDLLTRHNFNLKIAPGFFLKKSSRKILRRIYPSIRFVGETENLARSFFEADIALITAGTCAYEAASGGTPALYLYKNKEQEFTANSFEKNGAGLKLSKIDEFQNSDVIEKINQISLKQRIEMGKKGKMLVDGMGVYRVIDFLKNKGII